MAQVRPKRDAALQENVLRELGWDTRVEAPEVGVEVDNGVVTLTGMVKQLCQKAGGPGGGSPRAGRPGRGQQPFSLAVQTSPYSRHPSSTSRVVADLPWSSPACSGWSHQPVDSATSPDA